MAKAKKGVKKSGKELVVVTSKVKDFIRKKGFMCSGELPAKLSEKVCCILAHAMERTAANRRKTVGPQDL